MAAPDLTDRATRVKHALANPGLFGELYFRPYDPNWTEPLPPFALQMLAFMTRARKGVVMLPPEFLKTTVLQVYALWLTYRAAAFGQLLRGMLMSEEEGMAKGNLSVVKWHIEHNHRLADDFATPDGRALVRPSREVDKWSDESIIIEREGVSRDPTWQAKGIASKGIHGRRLDVFLGDDLVTPKNAESPALRKTALDTMDLQIETRIVAEGQMLVAGNFNHDRDLVSTLARRERWQVFRRPSMHQPGAPEAAPKPSELHDPERAEVTWPQVWSRRRLLAEFHEKPNRFRRIHLLDPRAESGERLATGWVTVIEQPMTPVRYCRFYIGLDPAPGGTSDDLDFFNISVLALHAQHADLVESFNIRASTPKQCELVGLFHDRYQRIGYGVVAIGGAKQALDAYFRGALQIARPDLTHKVEPISIPGQKEVRLEGLGPFAQSGWLRVQSTVWAGLTSDLQDRHEELSLQEEWRDFPFGRHDDRLDGLDIAIRTATTFGLVGDTEWELEVLEG